MKSPTVICMQDDLKTKSEQILTNNNQQETTITTTSMTVEKSSFVTRFKRGLSCDTCDDGMTFEITIGWCLILAILGLIGYIIYVYGFNGGNWNPNNNNNNNFGQTKKKKNEANYLFFFNCTYKK